MSAPDALPGVEAVLDRLREHAAHPEWVGPTLQPGELLVLFDHLDRLGEQARRADVLAAEFWQRYIVHSGKDYALAALIRHWREFYALLTELPNPHTQEGDHGQP